MCEVYDYNHMAEEKSMDLRVAEFNHGARQAGTSQPDTHASFAYEYKASIK